MTTGVWLLAHREKRRRVCNIFVAAARSPTVRLSEEQHKKSIFFSFLRLPWSRRRFFSFTIEVAFEKLKKLGRTSSVNTKCEDLISRIKEESFSFVDALASAPVDGKKGVWFFMTKICFEMIPVVFSDFYKLWKWFFSRLPILMKHILLYPNEPHDCRQSLKPNANKHAERKMYFLCKFMLNTKCVLDACLAWWDPRFVEKKKGIWNEQLKTLRHFSRSYSFHVGRTLDMCLKFTLAALDTFHEASTAHFRIINSAGK